MDLASTMIAGTGGGMLFRVLNLVIGYYINKSKNHENACNHRISGLDNNGSGINSQMDDESIATSNWIAHGMFWVFAVVMLVCLFFPGAEYKRFVPAAVPDERLIDLILFKWSWGTDLELATVYTSSGDILHTGMGLISFCITAFFKPSK